MLYEFTDYFREKVKNRRDRDKRYELSQQKRLEDIKALIRDEDTVNAVWCKQFNGIKKKDFVDQHASLFLDGMAEDVWKSINAFNRATEKQIEKVLATRSPGLPKRRSTRWL